ncbi:hypothetical protein [Proteiniclasticum sp.]|uniref:hypothetical protein n=1 Tax=Proteiniclasticum sp. TaxID=2053595 RepID=UPI00289D64F0|nr:hypothetical protein [Proteiniclasticum sp.]
MNRGKFHEKEELLRVIFLPISNRLKAELGSSLVDIIEDDLLFVTFLTNRGDIKLKCSTSRFMITEFSVHVSPGTIDFILHRIALFLRRNDILVISIREDETTEIIQAFLKKNYADCLLNSYGENTYLELKVMDYIDRFYKNHTVDAL